MHANTPLDLTHTHTSHPHDMLHVQPHYKHILEHKRTAWQQMRVSMESKMATLRADLMIAEDGAQQRAR